LFSFGREIELANLDSWVDDPAHRALLVEVVDAFIEVTRTRKLSPERLAPVVAAASHPAESVRALGITRLVVLAHYFDDACAALAGLVQHPDADVRRFAVSSLANAPEQAVVDGLTIASRDADWQIRKAAAQVGTAFRAEPVAALLRGWSAHERDARVRVVLDLAIAFQAEAD
jgi:HEAT repeat protein